MPKSATWITKLRDIMLASEPPVPDVVLEECYLAPYKLLAPGSQVVVKVSCAYDLPYPFSVSSSFISRVVNEIHTANPAIQIFLMEGGVRDCPVLQVAAKHGLCEIEHATFVDAEDDEATYVLNSNPSPYSAEGFMMPSRWVNADSRVLLTTCKLRSHHFQRWYSGGTRNMIGLLARSEYKLPASKRNMRSAMHQQGMDNMVADLYTTAGQGVLTILDARLLARQDEHLPIRFTKRVGKVLVAADPYDADLQMAKILNLPFVPPYLEKISRSVNNPQQILTTSQPA